jgi:host factor-I protein
MQTSKTSLQDAMLSGMRRSKTNVTFFLMNGFQLRGQIHSFDPYMVLLLQPDGKQFMVYKHAISTIVPEHAVDLGEELTRTAGQD